MWNVSELMLRGIVRNVGKKQVLKAQIGQSLWAGNAKSRCVQGGVVSRTFHAQIELAWECLRSSSDWSCRYETTRLVAVHFGYRTLNLPYYIYIYTYVITCILLYTSLCCELRDGLVRPSLGPAPPGAGGGWPAQAWPAWMSKSKSQKAWKKTNKNHEKKPKKSKHVKQNDFQLKIWGCSIYRKKKLNRCDGAANLVSEDDRK